MKAARAGGTKTGEFKGNEQKTEMRAAYYYNDLVHHGRAGFLWQKLRDPRSYDYLKTETKGYDDGYGCPSSRSMRPISKRSKPSCSALVADPPAKEYISIRGAGGQGNQGEVIDRL